MVVAVREGGTAGCSAHVLAGPSEPRSVEVSDIARAFGRERGGLQVTVCGHNLENVGCRVKQEGCHLMTAPEVSSELVEWAHLAGYSLTPKHHSDAAVFWTDPGGEIRFYIRNKFDGSILLTKAERAAEEQFELAGISVEVIERHLYGVFGWDIRHAKRLTITKTPRKVGEIAEGYRLSEEDSEGFRHLSEDTGTVVATAAGGLTGVTRLVELSHLIASSPSEIKRSYESPDGAPLFRV